MLHEVLLLVDWQDVWHSPSTRKVLTLPYFVEIVFNSAHYVILLITLSYRISNTLKLSILTQLAFYNHALNIL